MSVTACFAYGSNLDPTQMKDRCPAAGAVGKALLPDHGLRFTRFSKKRGGGVADVVPVEGSVVWGVIFNLNSQDLAAMDKAEGYDASTDTGSYLRRPVTVWMNGNPSQPRDVQTYLVSDRAPQHVPPTSDYMQQIVVGARAWGLPDKYVSQLMGVQIAEPIRS